MNHENILSSMDMKMVRSGIHTGKYLLEVKVFHTNDLLQFGVDYPELQARIDWYKQLPVSAMAVYILCTDITWTQALDSTDRYNNLLL